MHQLVERIEEVQVQVVARSMTTKAEARASQPLALEVFHLSKTFGRFAAVRDLSLSVHRARFSGCWVPMDQAKRR